jgi:CIC family chloride channel protein
MLAVAVSLLISRRLMRESVYTLGLVRKGIHLDRGRDVEILEGLTVSEIMRTTPETLEEFAPLSEASERFAQTRRHGMAVLDSSGGLCGILTVQDLDRALADGRAGARVGEYCTRHPLMVAYPDETMGAALRRMGGRDVGRLPVVARENNRQLLGILSRSDLVRAYDVALSRHAMLRQSHQQARLDATRGDEARILEIVIEAGAPCEGQLVKQVPWPRESVLASLRRGGKMIIPRGETRLHAGDVLVTVLEGHTQAHMRQLCKKSEDST